MSKKTAYVIRHLMFEDLGSFKQVLIDNNFTIKYFDAGIDSFGEIIDSPPNLLVILGGPISVNNPKDYPFINDEIDLLVNRITLKQPIIGICLGAQLIAKALGAGVFPCKREIGWSKLQIDELGERRPINILSKTPVFHWHGEAFELPPQATLLAKTDSCNQAFSIDNYLLGLQFHPEVIKKDLEKWFIGHTVEIQHASQVELQVLRRDTALFGDKLEMIAKEFWKKTLQEMGLIDCNYK